MLGLGAAGMGCACKACVTPQQPQILPWIEAGGVFVINLSAQVLGGLGERWWSLFWLCFWMPVGMCWIE